MNRETFYKKLTHFVRFVGTIVLMSTIEGGKLMERAVLRRSLGFIITFCIMFFAIAGTVYGEDDDLVRLKVLHTNDLHAKIDEFGKIAAYIDAERESADHSLYLDAGDIFSGNPVVDLQYGSPIIELLNNMEVDAMTIGNHEFDYGQAETVKRMEQSNFPWLSANTYVTGDTTVPFPKPKPYEIFEVNGVTVGVFALTQAPPATGPANIVGIEFGDPIEVAKEYERLADETDILIALTHIGYPEDRELAEEVDFFDVIIGAHTHTTLTEPAIVNGTPIVQTGSNAQNIGNVTVTYDSEADEVIGVDGFLQPVEDLTEIDSEIQGLVDKYNGEMDEILSEEIGETSTGLDRNNFHETDSSLGNFWTDAMRHHTGADIAFTNTGGIRADIAPGTLTVRDIYTVEPFENEIMTMEITGAALKDVIHYSYTRDGRNQIDLQTSGLHYTIITDRNGQYLDARLEKDGKPVKDDETFVLAVSDFLASGGSGYNFVGEVVEPLTGKMTEAMINYAKYLTEQGEKVDFYNEGRIAIEVDDGAPVEGEVIGSTNNGLSSKNKEQGDTGLGNLYTDAVRAWTDADFAILNGSSVTGSIPAGDILDKQIEALDRHGNEIVAVKTTGKKLKEMILSQSQYANQVDIQVSGFHYSLIEENGKFIDVYLTLPDGSPLDLNAEYVVAYNDYMHGAPFYNIGTETVGSNFGPVWKSVVDFVKKHDGPIDYEEGSRIKIYEPSDQVVQAEIKVKDGMVTVADASIARLADKGTLIIDLPSDIAKITVHFTEEQLRELVEKQATIVIMRKGEVSLVIPAIEFAENSELSVGLERLDMENPISVVYDFTIKDGEKEITEFNHAIEMIFVLNEEEVTNKEALRVAHLNKDDEWEALETFYEEGMAVAFTDHFSTFTVIDVEKKNDEDSKNPPGNSNDDENVSAGSANNQGGKSGDNNSKTNTSGKLLPKTATDIFNLILIGVLLIAAGFTVYYFQRKKTLKA